jgi:hypothetical protein
MSKKAASAGGNSSASAWPAPGTNALKNTNRLIRVGACAAACAM